MLCCGWCHSPRINTEVIGFNIISTDTFHFICMLILEFPMLSVPFQLELHRPCCVILLYSNWRTCNSYGVCRASLTVQLVEDRSAILCSWATKLLLVPTACQKGGRRERVIGTFVVLSTKRLPSSTLSIRCLF